MRGRISFVVLVACAAVCTADGVYRLFESGPGREAFRGLGLGLLFGALARGRWRAAGAR